MTSLPALWRCLVDVVAIVDAIADALDFAHQRGLLHRDVKPANIFMTAGTSQRRILLADFGIGREIAHTGGLTATNMTVGTVSYAAPEQFGTPPWVQRAAEYR
jgi:serine/threonine protein kinase, bacterial